MADDDGVKRQSQRPLTGWMVVAIVGIVALATVGITALITSNSSNRSTTSTIQPHAAQTTVPVTTTMAPDGRL